MNESFRIKSFVRRSGRISAEQQLALSRPWGEYAIDKQQMLEQAFSKAAPLVVEIGFGNGASLLEMARQNPNLNFVGIEVHKKGIAQLLLQLQKYKLQNLKLIADDAVCVLNNQVAAGSIFRLQLYFPDPWQKRRQQKRRIVRAEFVELVYQKLSCDGIWHFASDCDNYQQYMQQILREHGGFSLLSNKKPAYRPATKFEQRAMAQQQPSYDLLFQKIKLQKILK